MRYHAERIVKRLFPRGPHSGESFNSNVGNIVLVLEDIMGAEAKIITTFKDRLTNLQASYDGAQQQIADLQAQVTTLQKQLADAQSNTANAKDQADLAAEQDAETLLGLDANGDPAPATPATDAQAPAPAST